MNTSKTLMGITATVVVLLGGMSNVEQPDYPKWLCHVLPPAFCNTRSA